jgi:hypothetical protein
MPIPPDSKKKAAESRRKVRKLRNALQSLALDNMTTTTPSTSLTGSTKMELVTPEIIPESESEEPRITQPRGFDNALPKLIAQIIPGGWRNMFKLFAYLDLGPNDPRMKLILAWNELEGHIELNELCEIVGISPGRLFGFICESAYEADQSTAALVRSMNQTGIVMQMVKFAKKKDGFKDREALLKSSGFLPLPRGTQVNVNATAQAGARVSSSSSNGRLDEALESMEEDTLEFTEVIRGGEST